MALNNREGKFNPPPQAPKVEMSEDEFHNTALLLALARIYDVLLVQVSQTDKDLARLLQEQHYAGSYLFPLLAEEDEDE